MKQFVQALNLAITIVCCMVFGFGAGYYLDAKFNSKPAFMIVGILVGTVFAFMTLYKMGKPK